MEGLRGRRDARPGRACTASLKSCRTNRICSSRASTTARIYSTGITISGTIGAAIEAASVGIPSWRFRWKPKRTSPFLFHRSRFFDSRPLHRTLWPLAAGKGFTHWGGFSQGGHSVNATPQTPWGMDAAFASTLLPTHQAQPLFVGTSRRGRLRDGF